MGHSILWGIWFLYDLYDCIFYIIWCPFLYNLLPDDLLYCIWSTFSHCSRKSHVYLSHIVYNFNVWFHWGILWPYDQIICNYGIWLSDFLQPSTVNFWLFLIIQMYVLLHHYRILHRFSCYVSIIKKCHSFLVHFH